MKPDDRFMQRCLALAVKAAEKGNSAVGAVMVKDDEIVSEATEAVHSKNDITCHAEIEAIRSAIKARDEIDLQGYVLYTTHEPCIMCSYAIRFYKISKVVYLHKANYLGGISSSMPLLITESVPPNWGIAPIIIHLKMEDKI